MPVVEARGLTKRFGSNIAVSQVDLEVERGTIVGLIGPSGSGKTTTVRMLLGAVKPSEGSASVLGVAPAEFTTQHRRKIGYMPQLSGLYPNLTIAENLKFAAAIYGMRSGTRPAIRELLDFVELEGHEATRLRNASGGMQRRTALAAALIHQPELLVLDEPTAGIDPLLRRKFWDRFTDLRAQGTTMLVTTQYVGEAGRCDVVAFLAKGKLIAFAHPIELARQAFGGDMLEVRVRRAVDAELLALLADLDVVHRVDDVDPQAQKVRVVVSDADSAATEIGAALQPLDASPVVSGYTPPFDDVFVRLAGSSADERDGEAPR